MSFFEKRPLCVALGIFIAGVAFLRLLPAVVLIVLSCVSAACALAVALIKRRFTPLCAVMTAVFLSGTVSILYFGVYVDSQRDLIGAEGEITAEVTAVSYASDYASYADVEIQKIGGAECSAKAKLECGFYLDAKRGDIIRLNASIAGLDGGDPSLENYYRARGCCLVALADDLDCEVVGKAGWSLTGFFKSINE